MEKSCKDIEDMLVDYADGQLSASESNEVAGHLAECEHCSEVLQALQKSLVLAGVIWADGLAETEKIRVPVRRRAAKARWPRYAAIAASILLLLTTSIVWRALIRPKEAEPTFADIERKIIESGNAARLLAATELLAKYPDNETIVRRQYRYIVETYPETAAAAKAKMKIQ
jgi:anti-sigma factor RsiW